MAPTTIAGSMPLSLATTSIICCSSVAITLYEVRLELHRQPRAADERQRNPVRPAPFVDDDRPVLDAGQPSGKVRLPVDGLTRHDLGQPAGEPPVVRLAPQRPIQAWR